MTINPTQQDSLPDSAGSLQATGSEFLASPREPLAEMSEVVRWYGDAYLLNLLEVPTDRIRNLLPTGLEPIETRPRVSLYCYAWNRIHGGSAPDPPTQTPFNEILSMALVQPDLSRDMPIPKWCFYAFDIGSDEQSFVSHEGDKLKLATSLWPTMTVEGTDDLSVRISDDSGEIFGIECIQREIVRSELFREQSYWSQFYTEKNGELYFGACCWEGYAFEQQLEGHGGQVNLEHPYLRRLLDTWDAEPRLYMQVCSLPGTIWFERFWGMQPVVPA